MPSPFPGMDPWLESPGVFPDLHNTFIAYFREAISTKLPKPYYTAIATRVYVEESDRLVEPDVDVLRARPRRPAPAPADEGGGVAVETEAAAEPVVVRVPAAEATEWAVEVRNADSGDRLVTSVEVLSRSNKRPRSKGRRLYLAKRRELSRGRVNTVEIDLLRAGTHATAVPLGRATARAGRFDYHVCVRRAAAPEDFEVYPVALAARLPAIRVPLLRRTPDVVVPLQPVLDRCYDVGSYGLRAKYAGPCDLPLNPEQQAWAEGILKAKGVLT